MLRSTRRINFIGFSFRETSRPLLEGAAAYAIDFCGLLFRAFCITRLFSRDFCIPAFFRHKENFYGIFLPSASG